MAGSLEFLNLAEFEARALAGLKALEAEAGVRLEACANAAADDMRSLAPVLSVASSDAVPGELRDSIAVHAVVGAHGPEFEVGSFNVRYSSYQEFGTSKMAAHPFLRPALATARVR